VIVLNSTRVKSAQQEQQGKRGRQCQLLFWCVFKQIDEIALKFEEKLNSCPVRLADFLVFFEKKEKKAVEMRGGKREKADDLLSKSCLS
jgi:hypothetical protein